MKKSKFLNVMILITLIVISVSAYAEMQAWIGWECVVQRCGGYQYTSPGDLVICPKFLAWCPGECYQCISLTSARFCFADCNTSSLDVCWIPLPSVPQTCGIKYEAECYKDVFDKCKCPSPGSGEWVNIGGCTVSLCMT